MLSYNIHQVKISWVIWGAALLKYCSLVLRPVLLPSAIYWHSGPQLSHRSSCCKPSLFCPLIRRDKNATRSVWADQNHGGSLPRASWWSSRGCSCQRSLCAHSVWDYFSFLHSHPHFWSPTAKNNIGMNIFTMNNRLSRVIQVSGSWEIPNWLLFTQILSQNRKPHVEGSSLKMNVFYTTVMFLYFFFLYKFYSLIILKK